MHSTATTTITTITTVAATTTDALAKGILWLSPVVALILTCGRLSTYGKLDGISKTAHPPPQRRRSKRQQQEYQQSDNADAAASAAAAFPAPTDIHHKKKKKKQRWHWLGPMLSSRWSWMIFESPCWIWTLLLLLLLRLQHSNNEMRWNDNDDHSHSPSPALLDTTKTWVMVEQQPQDQTKKQWFPPNFLHLLLPLLVRRWFPTSREHGDVLEGVCTMPTTANRILVVWFLLHYMYRSLIYPLYLSPTSQMPLGISLFALAYTCVNGYLQAYDLIFQQQHEEGYEHSWQFQCGLWMGILGFTIGYRSDHALLKLKRPKDDDDANNSGAYYQIPRGGLFEYVSSPHYLGELVEWTGFCVACNYSLASLSFVVWTAANLVPRAYATHRWYHDNKFGEEEEYAKLHRKAIIPFIF
jgi:3-oxo-5-alpha-steroid 4-dehydrogenase